MPKKRGPILLRSCCFDPSHEALRANGTLSENKRGRSVVGVLSGGAAKTSRKPARWNGWEKFQKMTGKHYIGPDRIKVWHISIFLHY